MIPVSTQSARSLFSRIHWPRTLTTLFVGFCTAFLYGASQYIGSQPSAAAVSIGVLAAAVNAGLAAALKASAPLIGGLLVNTYRPACPPVAVRPTLPNP